MAGDFIQRSRHGTVFYFRRRVPVDLRPRLRRFHLYASLRTESLAYKPAWKTDQVVKIARRLTPNLLSMPSNGGSVAIAGGGRRRARLRS